MLKTILKGMAFAERKIDTLRWHYMRKQERLGPLRIIPYRGFGNRQEALITGRLLECKDIQPARQQDSIWKNLKAMGKRFLSTEIPNARIQAEFLGKTYQVSTDEEGYFSFTMQVNEKLDDELLWHPVKLILLDKIGNNESTVEAEGHVLIATPEAEFGVISDVDDTVLKTNATSFIRMMKETFLMNASTRLPFKGVAGFYRALHMGGHKDKYKNPLYFVSSSPWNLYDMLEEFWEINKIPAGPFLLRDLGLDENKFIKSGHLEHKLKQVESVFAYTKNLPFILIGDSGQHDPEIYRQVVHDFPGRVIAIYIRDVTMDERDAQVVEIIEHMAGHQEEVEMLLVKDTEMAARHALSKGLILEENLIDVLKEKSKDESPTPADVK
jgi:phosphatidate phosphatase APP1